GQPARDLGFADTGGADHDDVLGRNFVAQIFGHVLAAPTVAQGDGHRALGGTLPDDIAIELFDDGFRSERRPQCHRCKPRKGKSTLKSTVNSRQLTVSDPDPVLLTVDCRLSTEWIIPVPRT